MLVSDWWHYHMLFNFRVWLKSYTIRWISTTEKQDHDEGSETSPNQTESYDEMDQANDNRLNRFFNELNFLYIRKFCFIQTCFIILSRETKHSRNQMHTCLPITNIIYIVWQRIKLSNSVLSLVSNAFNYFLHIIQNHFEPELR